MGHLAVQVLTIHLPPIFESDVQDQDFAGKMDETLLTLWPVSGSVKWPPPMGLKVTGYDSVVHPVQRFKTGDNAGITERVLT
jgi:hypothetical protein